MPKSIKNDHYKPNVQATAIAIISWVFITALLTLLIDRAGWPWPSSNPLEWTFGIALSALAALGVAFLLKRSLRVYIPAYPEREPRFEVIRREVRYTVTGANLLEYSRVLTVRALSDKVDLFVDRYYWTGTLRWNPIPGKNVRGITVVEPKVGMYDFFVVQFARVLRKGDEIEFEVRWPAIDNWEQARPYISVSTEEPTRYIQLIVTIPQKAGTNHRLLKETYRAAESLEPFESEDAKFDDHGQARWEINRPGLYRHYRLRWSWNGEPPGSGLSEALKAFHRRRG